MKQKKRKDQYASIAFLLLFLLWTVAISFLDKKPIGPDGSVVGFATLNAAFHRLTGVDMLLYHITDWLGLIPIFIAFGFFLLGLFQWIKRKSLKRVDFDLFILGGFYLTVIAAYLFFESIPINFRPILINGFLEPSYPSSTTLLVMTVIPTAMMQLKTRIRNHSLKVWILTILSLFLFFMVAGRLLSGVHWFTDIAGGALLSSSLVLMYRHFAPSEFEI